MDWESCYLVMVDPGRNVDKHWQITRKGTRVLRQWGRRGGGLQQSTREHDSVSKASMEMVNAVDEKLAKGYERHIRGGVLLPAEFEKHGTPVDTRAGYFIGWKAAKPISHSDIQAAAEITQKVLDEVHGALPVHLEIGINSRTLSWVGAGGAESLPAVTASFIVDGKEVGAFGHPTQTYLDALNPGERRRMLDEGICRDAWVSTKGKGVAMIETRRSWEDFPIRLFLSVLAANAEVIVDDVDDQPYGVHGFRFNAADHRDFAWRAYWESVLKPAVQAHWLIEGEGILVGTPSLDVSPFAW